MLFDGDCAVCNGAVTWVLDHDAARVITFAPLAGPTGRAVLARHPALPEDLDSLVLVDVADDGSERVHVHSEAVLRLLEHLPGGWPWAARAARLVPRFVRDAAYRLFAAHRYRLFGKQDACRIVDEADDHRFLP
jgi:predicted DCC family thiol-disulfide oxidoreductase YuxK